MATRILYVITKANWGGAQRYVYDLATAAKERGYEASVAYGEPGLLVERLNAVGIRTMHVPALGRDIRPWKDFVAYQTLKSLFKKENPDVVHLNSSKAGYVGTRAARAVGIRKIIFTAHGWAFTESRNAFVRKVLELLQKKTALLSTDVIAVSEFIKSQTTGWNLPPNRIKVIRHGVREQSFLSKEDARNALAKIDSSLATVQNDLWVGTIAELHKNKGLDIGVLGWERVSFPNAQWIIMGGGEEKEKLLGLAKDSKTIHLLGFVPEAASHLKAFDLFLLPSRTEALGYVILEAGMAGVPVLASNVGGIPEATGYPIDGLFETENVDSLEEMLYAMLRNPEDLKETGKRLAQHVRTSFSFSRMIGDTFDLYR
jgi:glycosyltransferase involved in cell wall biosynthesis